MTSQITILWISLFSREVIGEHSCVWIRITQVMVMVMSNGIISISCIITGILFIIFFFFGKSYWEEKHILFCFLTGYSTEEDYKMNWLNISNTENGFICVLARQDKWISFWLLHKFCLVTNNFYISETTSWYSSWSKKLRIFWFTRQCV